MCCQYSLIIFYLNIVIVPQQKREAREGGRDGGRRLLNVWQSEELEAVTGYCLAEKAGEAERRSDSVIWKIASKLIIEWQVFRACQIIWWACDRKTLHCTQSIYKRDKPAALIRRLSICGGRLEVDEDGSGRRAVLGSRTHSVCIYTLQLKNSSSMCI